MRHGGGVSRHTGSSKTMIIIYGTKSMKNSEPNMKTRKTRLQACTAMSWEKLDEKDGFWGDVWKSLGTLQIAANAVWKRIPDSRSSIAKWVFTSRYQVDPWSFQVFLRWWSERTTWLASMKDRRQYSGKVPSKCLKAKMASLNWIQNSTGSRWSSMGEGIMWSFFFLED